jgi:pimeloyl-ACP methyl ester carboxylesterase
MRSVAVLLVTLVAVLAACTSSTIHPARPHPVGPRADGFTEAHRAGWLRTRVTRSDAPTLDVYLHADAPPRRRGPLVVLLQGSNCGPVLGHRRRADGRISLVSSVPLVPVVEDGLAPFAHYVLVERVGVRSDGPPLEGPVPRFTEACRARAANKELRVRDVADAILALSTEPWVERVLVVGHSEGSDIGIAVAARLGSRIAGIALLGGAGPTQFFDDVVLARREGRTKAAFSETIEAATTPTRETGSTEERYASARARSFALASTPLDDALRISIPIYVAHGDADDRVPIESADLFAVELVRRRRAIRYESYVGADHAFACEDGRDLGPRVLEAALRFLLGPIRHPALEEIRACQ